MYISPAKFVLLSHTKVRTVIEIYKPLRKIYFVQKEITTVDYILFRILNIKVKILINLQ